MKAARALLDQLDKGGRLVIPLETREGQFIYCYESTVQGIKSEKLEPVRFVPLLKGLH